MTPGAASALLAMSSCIERPMAEHWARLAYERGATVVEMVEAWDAWDALQAESVQVIHADPRPDTQCRCAHDASRHDPATGRCHRGGCGCLFMRPGGGVIA